MPPLLSAYRSILCNLVDLPEMTEADDIFGDVRARLDSHALRAAVWSIAAFPGVRFNGHGIDLGSSLFGDHAPCIIEAITLAQALAVVGRALHGD